MILHRHRLLAIAVLGAGCTGTPQPIAENDYDLPIDPFEVSIVKDGAQVAIHGNPGATVSGVDVTAINLSAPGDLINTGIEPDGSFTLSIDGAPSDVFRLLVTRTLPEGTSAADITADASGTAIDLLGRDCRQFIPLPLHLELRSLAAGDPVRETIDLFNTCSQVTIASVTSLTPGLLAIDGDFELTRLGYREATPVDLVFTPAAEGEQIGALAIELSDDTIAHFTIGGTAVADP